MEEESVTSEEIRLQAEGLRADRAAQRVQIPDGHSAQALWEIAYQLAVMNERVWEREHCPNCGVRIPDHANGCAYSQRAPRSNLNAQG
jgi:hypothetical protein